MQSVETISRRHTGPVAQMYGRWALYLSTCEDFPNLVLLTPIHIDYRLYHNNPWTDTRKGTCASFDIFLQQPVNFFMQRFPGMTRPVADLFANKVFCILDGSEDDSARMEVRNFGAWARELPALLGNPSKSGHKRVISAGSIQGHPIASSMPISHRPCSRPPSSCGTPALRTPAIQVRSLSRAPSLGPAYEIEPSELSTVIDQEVEEQEEPDLKEDRDLDMDVDTDGMDSRSQSNNKRRKRGARTKRKETSVPRVKQDETLETLAVASQSLQTLAREISKTSRPTTRTSAKNRREMGYEPPCMYPVPMALTSSKSRLPPKPIPKPIPKPTPKPPPSTLAPPTPASSIAKKPSKWKLSFGRNSSTPSIADDSSILSSTLSTNSLERENTPMSSKASNVTNLIMSLSPSQPQRKTDANDIWTRGRQPRQSPMYLNTDSNGSGNWAAPGQASSTSPNGSFERYVAGNDKRAVSPASARSSRPVASSASSTYSTNWRSSMSTTSSTSAFTRYSNASARSVATAATSISASSWRTNNKPSSPTAAPPESPPANAIPKNIKRTFFFFCKGLTRTHANHYRPQS